MRNKCNLAKRHYLLLIHPLALTEEFIQGFDGTIRVLEQSASVASVKNSVTYNDMTIIKAYHAERLCTYLKTRHNICIMPCPNNFKDDKVTYNQLKLFFDDPNIEIWTLPKERNEFTKGDFDLLKDII